MTDGNGNGNGSGDGPGLGDAEVPTTGADAAAGQGAGVAGAVRAVPRLGVSIPIEALQEVEMKVEVVLGRARLPLRNLLDVQPGVTIELDRSRNTPVDVLVNGTLFARGDIVVIDETELGVQVNEVVGGDTGGGAL